MSLDRSSIISLAVELPREEVHVPEWGGSVFVRTLTASERDRLELEWESSKRAHFRARLALYTACTEDGRDLFRPGDLYFLGNQPSSVITRICDAAFKLNKFTREDTEEIAKNSEGGPSEGPC